MTTNLDTLVTARYVKIDDDWADLARLPGRPPRLSHSELLCLAVMQAMLGFHCEARLLRHARVHYRHLFPFIPQDSGYNKRLRAALPQIKRLIRVLAKDTDFWHDRVWITDSTPVPCGMSRPTVKRSELAGWANYGYCASHSRFFWGLRLYLVCTPAGMPMLWALADPKLGEREVLAAMLEVDAALVSARPGLLLISDKGFASKPFERSLSEQGITLLRPSRKREVMWAGEPMLKKVRQLIESVNDTLKGQLDLEQHGGRTVEGVAVRVAQRMLALATAIWHNFQTGQAVSRSLTAFDH
ncbi:IS982 family transposase [Kitasatospora aureofaciens]|uniref:IS982 family transposase n=1 Tax=Kitasatospora aureofaciens TaxID=1894 RepID=UPI001C45F250|nr:IS982 family transposase [Kitasatospora aureofaciens]MBV6702769.1 IS982 family transposase [Kitasatospora aureofaciens]